MTFPKACPYTKQTFFSERALAYRLGLFIVCLICVSLRWSSENLGSASVVGCPFLHPLPLFHKYPARAGNVERKDLLVLRGFGRRGGVDASRRNPLLEGRCRKATALFV
jgi:hypothetical protein